MLCAPWRPASSRAAVPRATVGHAGPSEGTLCLPVSSALQLSGWRQAPWAHSHLRLHKGGQTLSRLEINATALVIALALPLTAQAKSSGAPVPCCRTAQSSKRYRTTYARGRHVEFVRCLCRGTAPVNWRCTSGLPEEQPDRVPAWILDEADTVPCLNRSDVPVHRVWEYATRIKPTASVSLARVFSCAAGRPRVKVHRP